MARWNEHHEHPTRGHWIFVAKVYVVAAGILAAWWALVA